MNVISRKLTNIEKSMEILNLHGGTSNIVVISKISGILSTKVIRQALDELQEQMPFLQCRIAKHDRDLYLTTESTAKIPLQVIKQTEFDLQDAVEKELNQTIDSSKYLIKTIVFCNNNSENINYLITKTHHAITDAKSCMVLHEKLFILCQNIQNKQPITYTNKNNFSSDDLIYVEEFMPKKYFTIQGSIQKNIAILKEIFRNTFNKHQTLKSEKKEDIVNFKCGITQRVISPEVAENIIKNCRQNQVSVQGAICAAMLKTVTNHIRKNKKHKIKACCRIGIDVRKRLNPEIEPEKLGLFASNLLLLHNISDEHDFWDLAKEVMQQTNEKLNNQEFFINLQIFEKVFEYFEQIVANPEKIANTVDVSNIGRVEINDNYGAFKLDEISFIPSCTILANTILVAVTSFKQQMILNFATSEPSVSQSTREILANNVISYLTNNLL